MSAHIGTKACNPVELARNGCEVRVLGDLGPGRGSLHGDALHGDEVAGIEFDLNAPRFKQPN